VSVAQAASVLIAVTRSRRARASRVAALTAYALLMACSASLARAQSALPSSASAGASFASEVDAALARYAHEPSVDQVVRAALRASGTPRAGRLAGRARSAGWVPKLALRARRGQTIDLSALDQDDALRVKSNDDLTLEASLSFELDRLVFRSEEVAIERQHTLELQARSARVRQVIALYFERRRLQVERDLDADPDVKRSLRIAEIGALLDVFTNGAFRRMIDAKQWTTGAKPRDRRSRSPLRSSVMATP
jgi:hypothetical protein